MTSHIGGRGGWIPPKRGLQAGKEETSSREGRSVGITPDGGRNCIGGTAGGGDLRLPLTEHGHTVYYDQDHCVPVSGDGAENRAKGVKAVVGTGQVGCGRDADSG